MKSLIIHTINIVRPIFKLNIDTSEHGIAHWARVWRNAREICVAENIDPFVPCLFSFLHDSCRYNEGNDVDHGSRAAEFICGLYEKRRLDIKASDLHLLCKAIEFHSDGYTDAEPVVQACWDADRLDLGRVGIRPDPKYLCTAHAKKQSTIEAALYRSEPWSIYERQL